jgi:putative two-component system response regulator
MTATDDERRGLELGAVDYIGKPLRPAIVRARVHTHLELKHARERLRMDNELLEAEIGRRMRENLVVQDVTIRALARLAETRDNETGNHILRTQGYVETLARLAQPHPRFGGQLDMHSIALMAKSAPLHDIGKVGIPDRVLLKPGRLTPDEWDVMKSHAQMGADAITRAVADTHQPVEFLTCATEIALRHHERWDGSGYPGGLAGEAIPLAARLMALADVFDALISRRCYKEPMRFEAARELMAVERGRHFDPDLLDIFLAAFDDFCDIARRLPDEPA